jgi:hypothetical protein
LAKCAHEFVALMITDRFVDLLEASDVDVDEEDRLAGPDRGLRRLGYLADHGRSREKTGQLVEMGFLDDIAHRLVDAGEERDRSASSGQRAQRRNDCADHFGRQAGNTIAETELQTPQAKDEAAEPGAADRDQPEDRTAVGVADCGHKQNSRFCRNFWHLSP